MEFFSSFILNFWARIHYYSTWLAIIIIIIIIIIIYLFINFGQEWIDLLQFKVIISNNITVADNN